VFGIVVPEDLKPDGFHKILKMIINYFKVASRVLLKHKLTTLINIAGLSIAMTATLLILLWVSNELSFDTYHKNSERIFRITCTTENPGSKSRQVMEYSPLLLTDQAEKDIPGIEAMARLLTASWTTPVIKLNDELFREPKTAYVDKGWFRLFSYVFVEGSSEAFNANPFSVILTESEAQKYFGKSAAVGKTIKVDSTIYTIQGVIKDYPDNSSFRFDIFFSLDAYLSNPSQRSNEENWDTYNYITFAKLRSGTSVQNVEKKLNGVLAANSGDRNTTISLKPIKELHFENDLSSSVIIHGNRQFIYVFVSLAFVLLLIACINYNNLTTAEAIQRSKEVSIRKIIGAASADIFKQFLVQSMMICSISLLTALLLTILALPLLNQVTDQHFSVNLFSGEIWKVLGVTMAASVALNCIYPSFLLSSFEPLKALKGVNVLKVKDVILRKTLVVIQFSFSIILLIATLIIYKQLHFIQKTDLNVDKARMFSVSFPVNFYLIYNDEQRKNMMEHFKTELQKESSISGITNTGYSVVNVKSSANADISWEGKDPGYIPRLAELNVDENFKDLFNLPLLQGRWFSRSNVSDYHNFVLNETAQREFNLQSPVTGKRIILNGDTGTIIGLVRDAHFQNLHDRISPLIFYNNPFRRLKMIILAEPGRVSEALEKTKELWKAILPAFPFNSVFMDSELNRVYKNEQEASVLILFFSIVSVFTALLGLLGLVILIVRAKTKEIGIRKVIGASTWSICALVTKEFINLVAIAFLIAVPFAYIAMDRWLQDFAYRINNSWPTYLLAGGVTFLLVLFIVTGITIHNLQGRLAGKLRHE
jgi:ABC-type antimicrobial peptide transport system permease subunit